MTPQERRERVVVLTRAGLTAAQIAEDTGITRRQVVRIRVREGVAQQPPIPLTPEEIRFAGALLDDGASYGETARTLGRSLAAVRRAFPGRAWTAEQHRELLSVMQRYRKALA